MNDNFTKITDTNNSVSELDKTFTELSLSGNNPSVVVDSTLAVDVILSATQFRQSVSTQFIFNNIAGDQQISILAVGDTINERASAIQRALELNAEGSAAKCTFIRTGVADSSVDLETFPILAEGENLAVLFIRAIVVTPGAEQIDVSRFLPGQVYIEGTWEPVITGSTSGTATAAINTARYTRNGSDVFFTFDLDTIANVDCLGEMQVSLPIPASAELGYIAGCVVSNIQNLTFTNISANPFQISAFVGSASDQVKFIASVSANPSIVLDNAHFFLNTNVSRLTVSGHYLIE